MGYTASYPTRRGDAMIFSMLFLTWLWLVWNAMLLVDRLEFREAPDDRPVRFQSEETEVDEWC